MRIGNIINNVLRVLTIIILCLPYYSNLKKK